MAQCFGALQAGRDRHRLGAGPTIPDDGGLHSHFGKLAKRPSDGSDPYALMVSAGMLPWSFFSSALSDACNSLLSNEHLVSLPRLVAPTAAATSALSQRVCNRGPALAG